MDHFHAYRCVTSRIPLPFVVLYICPITVVLAVFFAGAGVILSLSVRLARIILTSPSAGSLQAYKQRRHSRWN